MRSFIQSDLFTFHIGEQKSPFLVHSGAVAATSQYFDRLVHGGLSESHTRSAQFDDVDPDTFVRFLEYAYRGDYTTPSWTEDSKIDGQSRKTPEPEINLPPSMLATLSSEDDHAQPTVAQLGFGYQAGGWSNSSAAPSDYNAYAINYDTPAPSTKKDRKRMQKPSRRDLFNRRVYLQTADTVSHEPELNKSAEQDFTPVFLAHARLYTFADMRMVQPLKDLVLHKLHKTLAVFELYPERLGDVIELARHAYEHGEDRSEDGRMDALRDMVINYIALDLKVFGKHAEFRNLIREGGEFAGDFWDIASQELL